jgi:hypothetical protein
MKEDLRYIESLIKIELFSSHPSDKLLADFIDNKVSKKEKEELFKHLIRCDYCSDTVIAILSYKANIKMNTI